ncbi:MAG: transporter substrate-binding protein [Paenibacillaceae bacterium]|nr:transporter substrate-binding protein [Paenibacillaceae bacterium]
MKRSIAIGLTAILASMSLAACSSSKEAEPASTAEAAAPANFNAQKFPIVNEKITLKLMGVKAPTQTPWDQMDLFKEMERLTNIHFEFDTPPAQGYQERKNLAFASGEYPDVFFAGGLSVADETNYGQQGILIPLEGLIEKYAPNIKAMFEKYPEIKKSVTTTDGHIYALPQVTELAHNVIKKTWINGSWMEAVGIAKPPESTEELYTMLQAFKEKDPNKNGKADEVPFSGAGINDVRIPILAAFGYRNNPGINGWVNVINDKAVFVGKEEGYKQYLIYMNKLFKEKLLDNEIFSQTSQQFTAKGKANTIGAFVVSAPQSLLDVKTPEETMKHPPIPPMVSSFNKDKVYPLESGTRRGTFAITNKNKYPEATIRWVDYFYSTEGSTLLNSGIEGVGWKWTDAEKTKWARIAAEGKTAEETRATMTPESGSTPPIYKEKSFHYKIDDPVVQWLHKVSEEQYMKVAKEGYPLVYYTDEEQKALNSLTNDINTYVLQMEAKFIMGAEPISGWDAYVSTLNKMNIDQFIDIYQKAYDRWKK